MEYFSGIHYVSTVTILYCKYNNNYWSKPNVFTRLFR